MVAKCHYMHHICCDIHNGKLCMLLISEKKKEKIRKDEMEQGMLRIDEPVQIIFLVSIITVFRSPPVLLYVVSSNRPEIEHEKL